MEKCWTISFGSANHHLNDEGMAVLATIPSKQIYQKAS